MKMNKIKMTNSENWFYTNTEEGPKITGPFTSIGLCQFINQEAIDPQKIVVTFSGFDKWIKINDIEDFQETIDLVKNIDLKSLLPDTTSIEFKIAAGAPLTLLKTNRIEQRKHQRVDLELKAIFVSEDKSFKTKTINVSEGGLKLAHKLPEEFYNKKIMLYLTSIEHNISLQFETEIVKNNEAKNCVQFITKNVMAAQTIKSWIDVVFDQQKATSENKQVDKSKTKKIA